MNSNIQTDNEDLRILKQNFLKQQILDDSQYDANEFVEYMRREKPDVEGGDIDNWEFDELVEQVQSFKSMKQQLESAFLVTDRANAAGSQRIEGGGSFRGHARGNRATNTEPEILKTGTQGCSK